MSPDKIFIYVNERRISLAAFFAMDKATIKTVYASGCTALTGLDLPAAKTVYARGCTALTGLDLPAAEYVDASGCTALTAAIHVGADKRGYEFVGIKLRGQWRVCAGCRNFSIDDARAHWGPSGNSNRPDCLALVELISGKAEEFDKHAEAA